MPRSFAEVLFGGSPATAAGAGILIAIALIAVFARSSRRMIRTFKTSPSRRSRRCGWRTANEADRD
jgi:hypothetical protein